MTVTLVNEWHFPKDYNSLVKSDKNNSFFYIVKLQEGRKRYLKIGTTERTIQERFSNSDYKKYTFKKLVYVAEVTDNKDPKNACHHVEDLTRSAIRESKGFTFIKNDRFTYFQLPQMIPVYLNLNEKVMISLHENCQK